MLFLFAFKLYHAYWCLSLYRLLSQELAFIRGLKRSATVVCLERTELLSVEKEDFFSAKIYQCFNADMQRRVDFLQ